MHMTDMSVVLGALAAAIIVTALLSCFTFLGQCLSLHTTAVLQSVGSQPCKPTKAMVITTQVLKINKRDEVLTLSSGGCNSLNLLLHGAGHVVSVDCNPAQSALLELKATAIRSVPRVASVQTTNSSVVPRISPVVLFGLAD